LDNVPFLEERNTTLKVTSNSESKKVWNYFENKDSF